MADEVVKKDEFPALTFIPALMKGLILLKYRRGQSEVR